ncbi:YhgE/Pip domain-containing protein [Geomicrobium sp. JSM 1781026]|uniref:YhgE/Pip domain-containing protein n=1 Tax=Geomicrobium sp. JSM 1781026 TaxID=3344580 RepID=UPI0035C1D2B0
MLKRFTTATAALLLSTTPVTVLAGSSETLTANTDTPTSGQGEIEGKDEIVYANLFADGSMEQMYVVNSLDIKQPGTVTDYGSYEEVINLTDVSDIEHSGDEIHVEASDDPFFYQGNLHRDTPLPWQIDIQYELDGEEVEPHDLIGQSGQFGMSISVSENEDVEGGFFENYMVQISVPFKSERVDQIDAPDATVAHAGKDKQLTYTVMPEEEEQFELSAHISNFEFDGIEIAALPASISIDSPDTDELTEGFDSLTGAISELRSGLSDVQTGTEDLTSGLVELSDGSSDYASGMQVTADAGSELAGGSQDIQQGLQELNSALSGADLDVDFGAGDELFGALDELSGGMRSLSNGLDELGSGHSQAYEALESAIGGIPEANISEEELQTLFAENPESETVGKLVEQYEAAQTVKATHAAVKEGLSAIQPAAEEMGGAARDMAGGIDELNDQLKQELGSFDGAEGLNELAIGIDTLANEYSTFHSGLVEYTDGVSELNSSYSGINDGIAETAGEVPALSNGIGEIHAGMGELQEATEEIPDQMQEEIDEMISQYDKSDYDAVSFVAPEKGNVNSVQFVIQTASLTLPEEEDEPVEDEDNSFWDRLLQLFQ